MGDVTPKGYPYPTGNDLVMDGDNAIQALAEAIDTKIPTVTAGLGEWPSSSETTRSVTVTLPDGLFTSTPVVLVGARTASPKNRSNVSAAQASPTSFIAYLFYDQGTATIAFSWTATEQPDSAVMFATDSTGTSDASVSCPTAGCSNAGRVIAVPTHWVDDDGEPHSVDGVICGVCTESLQPTEFEV